MRTWIEKILQTSLQMESKISIAQIINDMICVKVDKASRSASPLRSQCPPARRPPTLRNSYITITSCTYHNIRSRASDPSAPQSVTPPPWPPPRPTRTVRRRPSAQLYISIGRSAIRTRERKGCMTTYLRPRQGWTTFSSFIQREAVPLLSDGVCSSVLYLVSLVTREVALVHAAASVSASIGSCADAGDATKGSSLLDSSSCFTSPP